MRRRPLCYMCLIFLIIRSCMMLMNGGQDFSDVPAASFFREKDGENVIIKGQIYKKEIKSKIQVIYLKNSSIYNSNVLVYDESFQNISIGETIIIKGKAQELEEAGNPGNFSQKAYYSKENIFGIVWCQKILKVEGKEDWLKESLSQLKMEWRNSLCRNIGDKYGGILSAILLSEKGMMDSEVKELYQKNGIGHVLAISGLHVSFIGLGIYNVCRKIGGSYFVSGIFAVLFLGSYVLMIGLSVSVVRAAIMLLFKIGADITGRVHDIPTSLALSAALTIARQPLYLFDAGFLMSYGAILGILLIPPILKKLVPCKWKWLNGFFAGAAINIMIFPVLLYFYFEFPTYSLVLNMIVIPCMSLVLGGGVLGSLCFLINPSVGAWILVLCKIVLQFFEVVGEWVMKLPENRVVFGQPEIWQIVVYYVIIAIICCWMFLCREEEKVPKLRKYIAAAFLGSILILAVKHWNTEGVQVTVVDVGQGDGIFIRGPEGRAYFIDGGSSDVNEVGKYRIEPFLKSQGVGKLDYVFISHGDADHYSGIEEMLQRQDAGVQIETVVLPENYANNPHLIKLADLAREYGVDVMVFSGGTSLTEDELTISCIQPGQYFEEITGNAGSMVLELTYGEFSMLCTGDVEEKGEERLTEKLGSRNYTVLKVAHHGSKNSTTTDFLEKVHPEIAIISAGKGNRYGHPHKETIERLLNDGSAVYGTVENGAVTLWTDGKEVRLEGFR